MAQYKTCWTVEPMHGCKPAPNSLFGDLYNLALHLPTLPEPSMHKRILPGVNKITPPLQLGMAITHLNHIYHTTQSYISIIHVLIQRLAEKCFPRMEADYRPYCDERLRTLMRSSANTCRQGGRAKIKGNQALCVLRLRHGYRQVSRLASSHVGPPAHV